VKIRAVEFDKFERVEFDFVGNMHLGLRSFALPIQRISKERQLHVLC